MSAEVVLAVVLVICSVGCVLLFFFGTRNHTEVDEEDNRLADFFIRYQQQERERIKAQTKRVVERHLGRGDEDVSSNRD